MEAGAQKQKVQDTKVRRRLLGKNLRFVQRVQLAATAKQAGGFVGRRRDEAAAKNEDYEGCDEEHQMLTADGGLLSCWRQIVRERGSVQKKKKKHAKMVCLVGENEKRRMRKRKIEDVHQQKVTQMITSLEGSAGLLHKISMRSAWRRGA